MKKLVASITIASCVVFGLWAFQAKAAGEDDALLQEIKTLREEIAELRQDLKALTILLGVEQGTTGLIQESARDAADASEIIGDLRTMKSAAIMLYADRMNEVRDFPQNTNIVSYITRYMDNPRKYNDSLYILGAVNDEWWVGFNLKNAEKGDGVKERLKERAESVGLYSASDMDSDMYTDQDIVWMRVR